MLQKAILTLFLSIFIITVGAAQTAKTAVLKGKTVNSVTDRPLYDIKVSIPAINVSVTTNGEGVFTLSELPYGEYMLVFSGNGIVGYSMNVSVNEDIEDIGIVYIAPTEKAQPTDNTEIPTITVEDNTANQDDDGASSTSSSGMFVAGQDPFVQASTYSFGQYYFRPRGVSNYELQVNGIVIDDLERGYSSWAQLGGLSDVLHGRSVTYGLQPSSYAYGGPNGTTYIDATAADQRKGNTVTYTRYNRNYRNRAMYTHSSGLMKNKWAWSVSGSRRWAEEGYTPGTYYDGYSFYGAASKVIGKGQLNFTGIYAPTVRGRALNATDEAYELVGDNQYNPAWGYQNGEKRNARVMDVSQPIFIANYTYRPSEKTRWNTAIGFETGRTKSSTIDFYNAYSPNPMYYRNLPSYYYSQVPPLTAIGDMVKAYLIANPGALQIDWKKLYEANRMNTMTIKNVNGIAGNDVTGKQSLYVLGNYVDQLQKYSFNTNIEHSQNEHLTLMGGMRLVVQQNENYKQVEDLLGGDFYVNTYQFLNNLNALVPEYAQNDLNTPNRLIYKGDKYGYDYILRNKQGEAWGQAVVVANKIDGFAALNIGYTSFNREGLYRNGLFPNNSFGKSEEHGFLTYKVKAGLTYKINLHNALYLNADHSREAPLMSNTYISAATRDFVINDPTTIKIGTVEAGYILKTHDLNMRFTGYVSDVKDNTIIKRFFLDDPAYNAFVSYVLNRVSSRSTGIEFAAAYRLTSVWSVTGVAAVGQNFYTSRPDVNIYQDNDPTMATRSHKVYINNYYLASGPQSAYSLSVNCRPGRWNLNVSCNYFDRNYVDVNPERRTSAAVDQVAAGSPLWNAILQQQRMPAAFTTDMYISRAFSTSRISKALHRNTSLFVSLGINNLLNNKNIKVAGYEQLRYDFVNRTPEKFQTYYDYAFGLNYSANISFRF